MKKFFKSRYISFLLALLMVVGVFLPRGGAFAKDDSKYNIDIAINIHKKDELKKRLENGEQIVASNRAVKVYKLKVDKEMTEDDRLKLAKEYDALTIEAAEKKLKDEKKFDKEIPSEKSKFIYSGKAIDVIDKNSIKDFKLENLDLDKEHIFVKDLEEGYYLIKETDESKKIPDAKLNTFVVKLSKDSVNDKNTLVLDAKVNKEVPNKMYLKLIKVDANNKDVKLNQAQFELYKKVKNGDKIESQLVKVSGSRGKYIYDEKGNTTVLETWNSGEIVVENVPEGIYYFKELKPAPGYKEEGNKGKVSKDLKPGESDVVENKSTPILKKIDKVNGKTLDGAVFELYKKDGKKVNVRKTNAGYEVDPNGKDELVTKNNGLLNIINLADGEYTIKEVKAPKGYKQADIKIDFDVKNFNAVDKDGKVKILVVENTPESETPPKTPTGGFNFVKIDSTKKENRLAGAKFILMKKESNGYKNVVKDGKEVKLTSPENGEFSITGLEYGEYALKEIEAPKNYTIDNELTPFKVDAASSSLPATKIVNKPFTPVITQSKQNTITTKYTPSDLTRIVKNPKSIVKTGDIRIIIMAVVGLIFLFMGVKLVNSDKRTQRA